MNCNYTALRADIRRTLKIALPLMGAQLLSMGTGLVDALVAGRIGAEELAAGGLGGAAWFFCALFCIGLMAGLSPTLSKLIGAGRRAYVGTVFRQGLLLATSVGIASLAVALLLAFGADWLNITPTLTPLFRSYLYAAAPSLPFFAIVMACRNVYEATGITRPVVVVQLLGLCINTIGNLGFGLGKFGLPAFGLPGIGWTTTLVNLCMAITLLLLLRGPRFKRFNLFERIDWPDWSILSPMLTLSVPILLALMFEAGLFTATALQMGMLGTLEAGAHYIAINITGFCYMLPLGLSFALTARIARVYGREAHTALPLRVYTGLLLTLASALLTATFLLLLREPITALYTADREIRDFAAYLILFAVVFQLSDGAQATLIGMLRGLQDTRVPMLINAFSYWVVAFGLGYYLAHHRDWGAAGLWTGLIIGLTLAAALLWVRLRWQLNQQLQSRAAAAI